MTIINHLGIYGVLIKQDKLLCIKKNSGPYKNRLDLPGGSQKLGEGLTETLVREVLEETGMTVKSYDNPRVYDAFVQEVGKDITVHHIMIIYDIEMMNHSDPIAVPTVVSHEQNDSDGITWVQMTDIIPMNVSPAVWQVKQEYLGQAKWDKIQYDDWVVKAELSSSNNGDGLDVID